MMRITIIGGTDQSVYVDGESRGGLDLSQCGLPANFWAFQWNEQGDNTGWIEYNSPMIQNDPVTEIPAWVTACIAVLQARLDQEAAEEEAERTRIAAQKAQQVA
jgi:hypothetical protein